jgi:hypothetical protein
MIITFLVLSAVGVGSAALYLLPLLIAIARRAPDLGVVAVVNIALGWTFVGWVAALALAVRSVSPPVPHIQVVQQIPPPPAWPGIGRPPRQAPPLMLPPGVGDDNPGWGDGQ